MGKNLKVVAKRKRRASYLKRKKESVGLKAQASKPRKTVSRKEAADAA